MSQIIYVDSGQILFLEKELLKDFIIDNSNLTEEKLKKMLIENKLTASFSSCSAISLYTDRTKVIDGVFCVRTPDGDGSFYFELNPQNCDYNGGDFIGFIVDENFSGDNIEFDEKKGTIDIEENGYYLLGDPCSIIEVNSEIYLEAGSYDICFFYKDYEDEEDDED